MSARLRFRPSSAKRWLNCPGQPLVAHAASVIPHPDSPEAAEGTRAHVLLASGLSGRPVDAFWNPVEHGPLPAEPLSDWLPTDELEVVNTAIAQVKMLCDMLGGQLYAEYKWSLRFEAHDYYLEGTADIVIVCADQVYVIDYKHGAGEWVPVEHNPQIQLYGAGIRAQFPGRAVHLGIIQPRKESREADGGLRFWQPPEGNLDQILALTNSAINRGHMPSPEFVPGKHCDKCEGLRGFCPAMVLRHLHVVAARADEEWGIDGALPWWILDAERWLTQMISKIKDTALNTLEYGGQIPGWSLGTKNGRRSWKDETTAPAGLSMALGVPLKEVTREVVVRSPITIGDAEKIAKKLKIDISGLIDTPKHRVLVPSDRVGYKPTAFDAVPTKGK